MSSAPIETGEDIDEELDPMDAAPARRTVSTVLLRAWIDGLGVEEAQRQPMLDEVGIESAILERWDLLVDAELELGLARWAVRNFGASAGFDAACALPRGALSVLEYLVRSADDFGTSLQILTRYQHLLGSPPLFSRSNEDVVRIAFERPYDIASSVECAIVEFTLLAVVAVMRDVADPASSPVRTRFRHAAPANAELYRERLRCPVEFDADESSVVFDRDVLQRRMRDADPRLQRLLLDCLKSVLGPRALGGRIADEVHSIVLEQLASGKLAVGGVAGQLGLTARTLQDRLKDEGTSYTELLESARRDLAHRYLREDQLSVPDVAVLLGYSEASAFHRAFKRWTGVTPRQYRSRRLP